MRTDRVSRIVLQHSHSDPAPRYQARGKFTQIDFIKSLLMMVMFQLANELLMQDQQLMISRPERFVSGDSDCLRCPFKNCNFFVSTTEHKSQAIAHLLTHVSIRATLETTLARLEVIFNLDKGDCPLKSDGNPLCGNRFTRMVKSSKVERALLNCDKKCCVF